MIRGIIFDCFGVLYGGSAEALVAACPSEVRADLEDLIKQADYGFISGDEYVAQLAVLLNKPEEAIRALFREQRVRNVPLVEYVRTLRSRYKMAMLSNISSGTMDSLISPAEQAELFDLVVLSCDVNLTKPDPNIFTLTAERLGLPPEDCVMIDDRMDNCEGARIAGMQAILYTANDSLQREVAGLTQKSI